MERKERTICRAWLYASGPAKSPVAGSMPAVPEIAMNEPAFAMWLYGPIGFITFAGVNVSTFMGALQSEGVRILALVVDARADNVQRRLQYALASSRSTTAWGKPLRAAICRYVSPATCSSNSSRCRCGSASTAAWIELQADAEGAGIASSPSTVQDRRARPSHSVSTSAAMRMTWRCGSSSRAESFAAHSRRETSCARTSTCTAAAIGRKSSPLRPLFELRRPRL